MFSSLACESNPAAWAAPVFPSRPVLRSFPEVGRAPENHIEPLFTEGNDSLSSNSWPLESNTSIVLTLEKALLSKWATLTEEQKKGLLDLTDVL